MMAGTYLRCLAVFCIVLVFVCMHEALGQNVGPRVGSGDESGPPGTCGISTCSALEQEVQKLKDSVKRMERALVILAELNSIKYGNGTIQSPQQTGNSEVPGSSGPDGPSGPAGNSGPDKRWWSQYIPAVAVGFQATRFTATILMKGDTLVFNRIITKLGSHYNPNTGIFVCPQRGTYIFSFSFLADKKSYIEASILKNETPVFNAVSDNRNSNHNQGGGTVIVKLNRNDNVKVAMTWPAGGTKGVVKGQGFTTFSGYLLREG